MNRKTTNTIRAKQPTVTQHLGKLRLFVSLRGAVPKDKCHDGKGTPPRPHQIALFDR